MAPPSRQATGPAVPAALARQDVTVLRLIRTAHGLAALLAAGTGPTASLLATWSADGKCWTPSPRLRLNGAISASASFGPGGTAAIIMPGNRADIIASASTRWRPLPPLPPGPRRWFAVPAERQPPWPSTAPR